MRRLIVIVFISSFINIAYSQKYRNSGLFIETQITQGKVLKSNDFVRGNNKNEEPIKDFSATDLRIGWQTRGSKAWHHALNLPYYGIGSYNLVFSNEEEIGYPSAVYFFFGAPFTRRSKSSFDFEFSFGLSYNWKPFDQIDNPFNLAIGSYKNAYIDAKIKYEWYFSKRFSLNSGLRVTHFSNGALRHPNAGINMLAPSVGVKYDIVSKDPIPLSHIKNQKVKTFDEFNISITSGKRSVKDTYTINHKMVSLVNISFEYLRPAGDIFKYGIGLDLGIDENRNLNILGNNVSLAARKDQLFSGLTAIGQFRANRLGVHAGFGYEIANNNKIYFSNNLYQRIGLRYYLLDHLFAGIAIKAINFSKADYIEWTVGYSISKS